MHRRREAFPRVVNVLEVGGSHVTAASVVIDGGSAQVTHRATAPVDPATGRSALLDALCAPALTLPGHHTDASRPDEWVVAIPGPFDYARGRGDFAGVRKFASLAGLDLRAELAGRLGTVPEHLRFLKDADAYGLGEWAFGAAGRVPRLVCITLGTGIGSAFVVDGTALADGDDVPPDASVHLIEIGGRPLEDKVSTRAIVAAHVRRTGHTLTVKAIAERAAAGDREAHDTLETAMTTLGRALAPWIARFGTSAVVVGGSMSRSWPVIGAPLRAGLEDGWTLSDPLPPVRPSTLLDDAPLLGAAYWLTSSAVSPTPQENR